MGLYHLFAFYNYIIFHSTVVPLFTFSHFILTSSSVHAL